MAPISGAVHQDLYAMMGASLSRWTMSFFAVALGALISGLALMAAGFGFPSAPVQAPQTLALVHLFTIGWLSLLLCGALFQFVPVLVARPLHNNMLPLPALVFLSIGLVLLIAGFLQLDGALAELPSTFPYATTALAIGFAITIYDLGRTLWAGRPLPLAARFVVVALLCLVATVALGTLLAWTLAGLVSSEILLAIAAGGLPLHVTAGLAGWLTLAAMGVSYRLLAMFMLAPEVDGPRPRAVLWLGTGALTAIIVGGIALLALGLDVSYALAAAAALGAVAVFLYGADVLRLYRGRKRRTIELNSQMAMPAFASLLASVVLVGAFAAMGQLVDQAGTVVFLAAFGWLSGLGLAKLYKIVAFMTWLECYGPVLGKAATPRVQDLVSEAPARKWYVLYYLGTWIGTVALALTQTPAFRFAAGAMALGTVMIAVHLVRTRMLANQAHAPLPNGSHRPRLLFSTSDRNA
jgi:hypothetical protein